MALINVSSFSEVLDLNIDFTAIIPNDLKKDEVVNVLFLFHGYQGYHKDWTRNTNIERYAAKYRLAVIMPSVNNSYYNNMQYGFNYFEFVNIELHKIVESLFNLKLFKHNTYIAGLSMGGYGALKSAFTYVDKYQGVASLSGAVKIDSILNTTKLPKRLKLMQGSFGQELEVTDNIDLFKLSLDNNIEDLKIFITCGKEDFLYEDNLLFAKHLTKNNINAKIIFDDGNHNWEYWDRNIELVLEHFFK